MAGSDQPARFPDIEVIREGEEPPPEPVRPAKAAAPRARSRGDGGAPLLEVERLTTRFVVGGGLLSRPKAAVHAVEQVSFRLAAGETLALVGESGCGKSTTARTILRLQEPTSGQIRFQGRDITELSRGAMGPLRRQMQMVFQDPFASLNPRLTALRIVGEPLRIHGLAHGREIEDRVCDLLRRVGLEPAFRHRYPHEFSGGQRQRICIARALALNPSLIVADEPVSALDVSVQAQVINLMMDLQEEFGISYLFVSHDLAVVERISHRVAVMYMGEIVELGPRAAVFENPSHAYTRKLMAAVPIADPRRRRTELRLMTEEIPSPMRPYGYEPEVKPLEEIAPGHYVMAA
jgi:glutathione transport system ATP-binding protein